MITPEQIEILHWGQVFSRRQWKFFPQKGCVINWRIGLSPTVRWWPILCFLLWWFIIFILLNSRILVLLLYIISISVVQSRFITKEEERFIQLVAFLCDKCKTIARNLKFLPIGLFLLSLELNHFLDLIIFHVTKFRQFRIRSRTQNKLDCFFDIHSSVHNGAFFNS